MLSSIKARIIVFYLAILLVTLSIMGIILYLGLSRVVYSAVDSTLLSRAKALATLVREDGGEAEFNFSDDVMWEYNSPKSKHFFQIRLPDGTTLEKSASLGKRELPYKSGNSSIEYRNIRLDDEPARQINFPIRREGEKKRGERVIVVQCAEEIDERIEMLDTFGLVLAGSILFIMIISASGGFLIARKAMQPVKAISETINRISETNLSERIAEENIPEELKGIASSFNRVFAGLEGAFNRQRQFVADASHELKTPLAVILTQAEVSLRRERRPDEYKTALAGIADAAKMMSLIIEKLLQLARLHSDKFSLRREKTPLNEILETSLKLLRPLADRKGIVVHMPEENTYSVYGDREALQEAFVNIIENAIRYNVPGGRITISLKKEGGFIVAKIADTGVGIPKEDLGKVFDRFYRVDKSRSRESGGIGLGLSIVREIVTLHGGRIEIKSRINEGSVVSVYLPEADMDNRFMGSMESS